MDDEQYYLFVDKSGLCFGAFQEIGDADNGERVYNDFVGALMRSGRKFPVGDMLCFRDDLIEAGFKWGIDFYVKKVDKA